MLLSSKIIFSEGGVEGNKTFCFAFFISLIVCMKITICWSSTFRKEKVEIKYQLFELGHEPLIDEWTEKLAKGEAPELLEQINTEHHTAKKQYNFIKMYYDFIKESDAIIVCNYDKKWINDYIGSNTFLEIGYAHVLGKKIFLLNNIPNQDYILDEIKAMDPIVLLGNLHKIK